jgi:hypothetical protein
MPLRATGGYVLVKGGTYTTWTLLWISSTNNTATLYPCIITNNATLTSSFIRVPARTWLPKPLCYDTFTRANGAIGTSETTGPDGAAGPAVPAVAWTGGATWTVASNKMVNTPNLGADLLASLNGDFAAWTADDPDNWTVTGEVANDPEVSEAATGEAHADTPTLGGEMCNIYTSDGTDVKISQVILAVGTWYKATIVIDTATTGAIKLTAGLSSGGVTYGTATTHILYARAPGTTFQVQRSGTTDITIASISVESFTLAELVNVPDLSVANVVAEIEIAVDPAGTQAGLAIGWDSQSSPANGILVYHDGSNVKIEKNVAGTWTTVQSTAYGFTADAKLVCVRDGSSVSVFYNNAKIGSTVTISDAAIVAGTRHGAFATSSTPTLDAVLIFPRTGGNYPDLNRWSGVNP